MLRCLAVCVLDAISSVTSLSMVRRLPVLAASLTSIPSHADGLLCVIEGVLDRVQHKLPLANALLSLALRASDIEQGVVPRLSALLLVQQRTELLERIKTESLSAAHAASVI